MAVTISLSITQNSQNTINNTSNVTVKVTASWTGGSNNRVVDANGTPQAKGWVKIDGESYDFASTFNDGQTTTGSKVICTKTVNVAHNANGAKTLACSASYTTGVSSGTVTASASKTLTTIPRKSALAVSNGTLDRTQTMVVVRQSDAFTHTIVATCGNLSTTICTKSTNTNISFKPPISWASLNTVGTKVDVTYVITTYNGNTSIGSNRYDRTCSIPESVKPDCEIRITDAAGYMDSWGAYLQGLSNLRVEIDARTCYDSPIKSYSTTVNGKTYTASSFTTDVITTYGTVTVTTTVTDKRGRSTTVTESITILEYSKPRITALSVHRCNEDGTPNDQDGEFVQVVFSATVSNPDDSGSAYYELAYKKTSESDYTVIELHDFDHCFELEDASNASCIFPADSGSSYDVRMTVYDDFITNHKTTTASTGYTIMHWKASGRGMAIGKVSELDDVLDIGMQTRFTGGLLYPEIEPETDLDEMRTPGFYVGENVSTYNYGNCPITAGTFIFEVLSGGKNGQVLQRLTRCDKLKPLVLQRWWYGGSWGEWLWAGSDEVLLYENAAGSSNTIQLRLNNDPSNDVVNASHFRYLEIYFTDNNGRGSGYVKVWNPDDRTVDLQLTEASNTIYSRQTAYTIEGYQIIPELTTASYYRITSAGAVNTSIGTNYIKIIRVVGRP